ncbi:DUF397 domain-containing protein [Saccharopolyspora sp. CA-218241]|uniref:DUF397 domain-containing protein n=1 Tax=Saccharopolyspora sp. CA-218241 TaxID=3240027 RepID=UPI003D950C4A
MMNPDLAGASWRKSSRSSGGANNCVEVGFSGEAVGVRDTKDRAAGYFTATGAQWSRFVAAIRTGRFES